MSHDQLRQKFSAWMADNFTPARTAKGGLRTRGGVTAYDDIAKLRPLLRGSVVDVVERFRRGEDVSPGVIAQIEEIVEIQDVDAILQLRRDQALEQRLEHAVSMYSEFGAAPDGGSLRAWAISVKMRLGAGLTDRARELWPESLANAMRRQRREAGHG